ncbi:isoniazid response ATPase/transcriptional regulator IniR [Mycobacterium sp. 1423905.2]|uniref:isoniazid response ATPase/transcriptional regulator IniR n=1 Tax=Mycobacterium sp. 1423905.2 TaxID=1856859 RepID=UPI000801C7A8|nr:isoniazid response ATPase/transcriptional regulator IniR [Mycobacterium sp. 1423905.2]OBJ47556.1 helix-turn-helix transcriptional regulator [Mycobacterium sp. 1423905.2]
MTGAPFDFPPAARDALRDVANAATVPVKVLFSGGIGTGKTTILSAARDTLRNGGLTVLGQAPRNGDESGAALVVDDLHLLSDSELLRLTECIADPHATVVAATEAREQRPALRALVTAIERERPRIPLGRLPVGEHLLDCTAGLPLLVSAVAESDESPDRAATFALLERLRRLDDPVLDTLLIMSLATSLGSTDVAGAQHVSISEARDLVDRARASGLVDPSHPPAFRQLVHDCVAQLVGNARHHQAEISLLRSQLEIAGVSLDFALGLAEHGLRDDRLAAILAQHAQDAGGDPVQSARLYKAAIRAGAQSLTSRLADALALTGDCVGAAALADGLLPSSDPTERAAAVRVAASVAAHDGNTDQAAELFTWLGPHPDAVVGAAAAIVLAAHGDLPAARAALRLKDAGPPTIAARASRGLAEGLLATMDQPYQAAMAKLGQSIATEHVISQIMPDSPAALVTLAAIHGGDPVRARSVIGHALRSPANKPFERRHLLLSGWIKMQEGQLTAATADATAACSGTELHRRDALWATALQTAIARRNADTGALRKHWYAAMEVLAEYTIDLFALLPLGELWVAAARMRQVEQLRHALDEAFALLDSLGNPPLWSISLHWSGVHAGILSSSPESVAPHGQALSGAATRSALAQVLSGAGRTWLRVLADQVNVNEVTVAARSLSRVGLTSDATRLAGQAALQTPDARVSGAMLQLARDLKLGTGPAEMPTEASEIESLAVKAPPPGQPPAGSPLSDREREVAELLLLGLPYRDIGGQLFISAKTVEHHVARIRRRLGAGSRSEMMSMLRAMLAPQA